MPPAADELGRVFAAHGHLLHLVGGSVRDALLGRPATGATGAPADLDFATDARPERVLEITRGWAEATWEAGIAFGTVGLARRGLRFEITTYRSEAYDRQSRNPAVTYGDSLEADLSRRDFTVNAMAVSVPGHDFVDLFGGMADLARGVLRTPASPEASFDDDPLRILRAARFEAALGLTPVPELVEAMRARTERLAIVSPNGSGTNCASSSSPPIRWRAWSGSSRSASPTSCCPRSRRCAWRSTSTTSTRMCTRTP